MREECSEICPFFSVVKQPLINLKLSILSHMTEEDDEASRFSFITDMAFTIKRSWLPLSRNSLAFLFLNGHSDLEASVGSQTILNWGLKQA